MNNNINHRRLQRAFITFIKWGLGALLLGCIISGLGVWLTKEPDLFKVWLTNARPWLQVWRLMLYATIAGLWLHRVRQIFMNHLSPKRVRRIEIMMLMLCILIEICIYHRLTF